MELSKIKNEYERNHQPILNRYISNLVGFIEHLLQGAEIQFLTIDSRVKDSNSFIKKIQNKNYNNPFLDIKDLSGIRIITYYSDDVRKSADLITRHFKIDNEHSEDKLDVLKVEEFGYRSIHLICELTKELEKSPEWSDYSGKPFEIQIRTISQHAWAALSHKIDYKAIYEVPEERKRLKNPIYKSLE